MVGHPRSSLISRREAMLPAIVPTLETVEAGCTGAFVDRPLAGAVGLAMTVPPISSWTLASDANAGFTVS